MSGRHHPDSRAEGDWPAPTGPGAPAAAAPPWSGPLPGFPVSTSSDFAEWQVERTLGTVFGVVVRSMGAGRGLLSVFRIFAGGEVKQYTKLLEDTRRHAMDRMIENARLVGANGVVMMRFDASEIAQSLTEVVAYGTAVVLGPRRPVMPAAAPGTVPPGS